MKKLTLILSLFSLISIANAATSSSAPVASSPAKSTSKTASKDSAVVIVNASNCDVDTPCYVIKTSATQLSQAVNQNLSDKEAMTMIQNSIVPQIDFNLMTKFAMGNSWKQANPEQQTKITQLFQQLLVYQYSSALSKFKGAQVSIDSSTINGEKQNKAAVKGTFKLPSNGKSTNQPVNIEWDLAKIASNWKIYDVKIENVSIVTTYRTQFNDTMQNEGVDSLIKQLQTKINTLQGKS
jgi:phospholipid transport system substrate-binding protein